MRSITVKGTGRISVKPDLIVVSMTLETKDTEYEKTMETAAEKIELLNKSLEEIGFEKESVKTTNFNVSTDYESVRDINGGYKRVLKGYVCRHNLKVEFDFDTKKLAKTLSAISRCLATPEFSVSFTVNFVSLSILYALTLLSHGLKSIFLSSGRGRKPSFIFLVKKSLYEV